MVARFEANFPFLSAAREFAASKGIELDALLSSESYEDSRARGAQRVEDAILNNEVSYRPLRNDIEAAMEIMSYPYARILVSAIDDKYLTRRYALSEAVRMNKLLGREEYSAIITIAQELDVHARTILTKEGTTELEMHFADYLRLSSRIKSPDWKLVNTEIRNGYVRLNKDRFARALQNALQDRIESELPMKLPDEMLKAVRKDSDRLKNILDANKSKFTATFTGELKPETLPPCIRTLLANAQNGVNLPHSGRFALVSFLHTIGLSLDQILALFAQSPDFDESKSIYQIKHITGELNGTDGYTPPECSTMKTNGICYDPDNLCAKETLNHPLTYFRIKTNPRGPQKDEGKA
ncbi:MAG: DNA primase large subunit PriL [Candidatus Methanomethylophilaceae archaeon]|nr:DNA primase large subunit PriL [Candidatus Methanomethylophilaceae archaeon]